MDTSVNKTLEQLLLECSLDDLQKVLGKPLVDLTEYIAEDVTPKGLVKIALGAHGKELLAMKHVRAILIARLSEDKIIEIGKRLNSSGSCIVETVENIVNLPFKRSSSSELILRALGLADDYLPQEKKKIEETIEVIDKKDDFIYEQLDYQYDIRRRVIKSIRERKENGGRALIHMPTGAGKTKTAMHIIQELWRYDYGSQGCILWMAHSEELLQQAIGAFKEVWKYLGQFDVEIVKLWGKHKVTNIPRRAIIFAGTSKMQSLMSRQQGTLQLIATSLNLLVVDESHRSIAKKTHELIKTLITYKNMYDRIPNLIGLTATPGRSRTNSDENTRLRKLFDDEKIGIDIKLMNKYDHREGDSSNEIELLQKRDILSCFDRRPIQIDAKDLKLTSADISSIKKSISSQEELRKEVLNKISNSKKRNREIIKRLRELNSEGLKTLFFSCNVEHAKMINAAMRFYNINSAIILGETNDFDRVRAIEDFKDNQSGANILINYGVLTTGFDAPNIDCVFIARPISSVILYGQIIGRGIRGFRMGGKKTCLLIDVIDNVDFGDERWAFNYFDRYWS